MVEGVSSAAQGKDYDFRENIPSSGSDVASPTSFNPAEITPEEEAAVDELMRRLGL